MNSPCYSSTSAEFSNSHAQASGTENPTEGATTASISTSEPAQSSVEESNLVVASEAMASKGIKASDTEEVNDQEELKSQFETAKNAVLKAMQQAEKGMTSTETWWVSHLDRLHPWPGRR